MVDVKSTIECKPREPGKKGVSHKLRATGWVPAVAYGPGKEPRHLSLDPHILGLQRQKYGTSHIFDVAVEGGQGFKAFVKSLQRDPMTHEIIHVDFYAVDMTKPIRVEVPVEVTGKAAGLVDGGIVTQVLRKVEVQCLPDKVPAKLIVDVSALTIGDSFHTSTMVLPAGVTLTMRQDLVVASCMLPEEEVVATPTAAEGTVAADGTVVPAEGAVAADGAAPAAAAADGKAPAKGAADAKAAPAGKGAAPAAAADKKGGKK